MHGETYPYQPHVQICCVLASLCSDISSGALPEHLLQLSPLQQSREVRNRKGASIRRTKPKNLLTNPISAGPRFPSSPPSRRSSPQKNVDPTPRLLQY